MLLRFASKTHCGISTLLTDAQMITIAEDGSRPQKWFVPGKASESIMNKAIQGVRNILSFAKPTQRRLNGITDANGDACTLWASKEDGYLDGLW